MKKIDIRENLMDFIKSVEKEIGKLPTEIKLSLFLDLVEGFSNEEAKYAKVTIYNPLTDKGLKATITCF